VADALSAILETQVRVENVAGDGGVVGTNAVASAPRDGSVMGLAVSSALIGGRLLSRARWVVHFGARISHVLVLNLGSLYPTAPDR
jgi:hypothetical protein